ncbi:MAG: LppX_LprAFG lipoprotein [Chloroflexia bacterium]|nr:LppX_LprAFG lipoprotein [Chloroflexia bacterium]
MSPRWRGPLWLQSLLLALLLFACGAPAFSMEEIAQRAGQAMAELESLHFNIGVEGGPAYIDTESSLSLRSAEGDMVRPDRVQADLKVGAGGLAVIDLRFIGIGSEQFLTKPISGEWQRMPAGWGFDPTVLFDREIGVETAITQVQWSEQLGDEKIQGVRCYHLRGQAPGQLLAPLTAWLITSEQVEVEAWVGQADWRIYQLRFEEPPPQEDGYPTIWLLQFSNWEAPVTIERPPGF